MKRPTERQKLLEHRRRLRSWLAGGAEHPLLVDHCQGCRPWDVMCYTQAVSVGRSLRAMIILMANALPFSSWKVAIYRLMGVRIGRGVYVAPGAAIDALFPQLITLEDGAFLGIGCRLHSHEISAGQFRIGRVRIGAGSVVGAHATVRSGVTVGPKATIGFDSFVNRDVPACATVVGTPARMVADKGEANQ